MKSNWKEIWFWVSLFGAFARGIVGITFIFIGLFDVYFDLMIGKFPRQSLELIALGITMMPPWDNGYRGKK